MSEALFSSLMERINAQLTTTLATLACPAERLREAMQYSALSGGKRLRPLLVQLTGSALACQPTLLDAPSTAIELIHCYSLIHDDLPAMDDDNLRRGNPTCHIAFDEATAILAGDALHTLAFTTLLQAPKLSDNQKNAMALALATAAGASGMVSGQMLDMTTLCAESLNEAELIQVHQLKTGRLIECSVELGLIAAKASMAQRESLTAFAKHLGLAFQIQDDYLDCYADTAELGKQQGADSAQNKFTFATCYSQAALKQRLAAEYDKAFTALSHCDGDTRELIQLTQSMQRRGS